MAAKTPVKKTTAGTGAFLTDAAEKALIKLEESLSFHDDLVNKVERRWREFEGFLELSSEASQWHSQLHPPFVNHIVETTVAGLLEDRFQFQVRPSPRFYRPDEFEMALLGAKAHEDLFRQQLKADRFNEFQRPYALDAAVVGLGASKTFWCNEVAKSRRLVMKDIRVTQDEYSGLPVAFPTLVEEPYVKTVFDGPVTESIDLRDMWWHEAAVSVEKARWMAHSIWMSYDDMLKLAKAGKYDLAAVESIRNQTDNSSMMTNVERDRENRGRNRDMLEALEIWDRETGRVITIGARKVTLRDSAWPFWHGEYPFVFTSLQPFPRSLRGMSIVEKLAHLQEAVWDLMNQRIDNVRFVNNFIQIIRSDVDDPDAFPFEPGAQWFMEDPTAVQQWAPNPAVAEISLGAETQMQSLMQNLAGGQPFTSSGEANVVNADTATQAALVTNLAQMAVKQMKTQMFYSYERIGCQRLYLNQQFIREPIYVQQIGMSDVAQPREILPFLLQGEYMFDVLPMSESLNRQERRAEANSLFQIAAQTQPVAAASGSPWNMKAMQEDLLQTYDKVDTERYLAPAGSAPQGAPGQPSPQQGGQVGPPPQGVTGTGSIAPEVSPSNQASLAPSVFAQRNLAMTGGVNNK